MEAVCTLPSLAPKLQEAGAGDSLHQSVFFWLTASERLDRLPLVFALPATRLFVHEYLLRLSGVKRSEFIIFHPPFLFF
jgi:hypothetical protein